MKRSRIMTQGIDNIWQVEARTQETMQPIRDIKRITRRKFTAGEKICIVPGMFTSLVTPSTVYCALARPLIQLGLLL
jgi:hypothetical protein